MPRGDENAAPTRRATTSTSSAAGENHPPVTVELHRHFEAGLRPELVAQLAAKHGITAATTRAGQTIAGLDPQDPDSIRAYYRAVASGFRGPGGFERFVDSFGLPLSVIRTLEDLEAAVCDQLLDCAHAGSLHTELRGSPFTYGERIDAPVEEIAAALVSGVDLVWRNHGVSGTFILAFSRQKGVAVPEAPPVLRQAPVIASLAASLHRHDRPVGLDIAGFPETAFPPRLFEEALRSAREAGVPLTVHAGEQGTPPDFAEAPPSLIVEAVEHLGAKRIGHATSLARSAEARELMLLRGIGLECCPWSNCLMGFTPVGSHPLKQFLSERLLASIATDDPLMFGTLSVTEVFDRIAAPLALEPEALGLLTDNAVETAFVSEERRQWLRAAVREARAPRPEPRV